MASLHRSQPSAYGASVNADAAPLEHQPPLAQPGPTAPRHLKGASLFQVFGLRPARDAIAPHAPPSTPIPKPSGCADLLALAGLPMLAWPLQFQNGGFLFALMVVAMLLGAVRLIAIGAQRDALYRAARVAKAPRVPRKALGIALLALTIALLSGLRVHGGALPLALGLVSLGLGFVAFGVDPMRDKREADPAAGQRVIDQAIITEVESTLREVAERVQALNDPEVTHRTQAACTMAMRFLRAAARSPDELQRMRRPLARFSAILSEDIVQLEQAWPGETRAYAHRRFLAKLDILTQSFEGRVRSGRLMAGQDIVDLDADLLSDRIPQQITA